MSAPQKICRLKSEIEAKNDRLINQMTLEEKVDRIVQVPTHIGFREQLVGRIKMAGKS